MADPGEVTNWTIAGVAGGGSLLMLARWVVRTFHADKLANKAADAETNVIDRLQREITRLEEIIKKQGIVIADMQVQISGIRTYEVDNAADLTEIAVLVDRGCQGNCPCSGDIKQRVMEAVARIRDRRPP